MSQKSKQYHSQILHFSIIFLPFYFWLKIFDWQKWSSWSVEVELRCNLASDLDVNFWWKLLLWGKLHFHKILQMCITQLGTLWWALKCQNQELNACWKMAPLGNCCPVLFGFAWYRMIWYDISWSWVALIDYSRENMKSVLPSCALEYQGQV